MAFLSFPTFFGLLPPTSLYVLTKAICPETSQTHSSTPCSYPPHPHQWLPPVTPLIAHCISCLFSRWVSWRWTKSWVLPAVGAQSTFAF